MALRRVSKRKFERKHSKYVYQHPEYKRELFVDNFVGGGGASTGIEIAIGRSVDAAINRDLAAIVIHQAYSPDTLHYCESELVWLSPDCKHFSKAKGGKPVEKTIRGLGQPQ